MIASDSKEDTKSKKEIGAEETGKQGSDDKLDEEEYDEDIESLNSDEEEDEDVGQTDVSLKLNPDGSDEDFDNYVNTHDKEEKEGEEGEESNDDITDDDHEHEIRKDDANCQDKFNSGNVPYYLPAIVQCLAELMSDM